VLELCQDIARDKTLEWLEESVAEIRGKAVASSAPGSRAG
jgi:hypothetical protein